MSQLTSISSQNTLQRVMLRMKKQLQYDWITTSSGALWRLRAFVLPNQHEDGQLRAGITFSVTHNGDASDNQYSLYLELSQVDGQLVLDWSDVVQPPSKRDLWTFEGIYPIGYLLSDITDCAKPYPVRINVPILPTRPLLSLEA